MQRKKTPYFKIFFSPHLLLKIIGPALLQSTTLHLLLVACTDFSDVVFLLLNLLYFILLLYLETLMWLCFRLKDQKFRYLFCMASHIQISNLILQADIFRTEKNIIDLYIMLLRYSR